MIRATTPTHKFNLHTMDIKELLITYKQGNRIVLEKRLEDVHLEDGIAWFDITQEEANRFAQGMANVQARILTKGDKALASQIFRFAVASVLSDEVLS